MDTYWTRRERPTIARDVKSKADERAQPERGAAESVVPLLVGVGVQLGFGVCFFFVVRGESPWLAAVGLAVMGVTAASSVAAHVHRSRQRALFGDLPLHLETQHPRLGRQCVGAFDVKLELQEIDSAWVALTCSCVHPPEGDNDGWATELWSQRVVATLVSNSSGCKAAFVLSVPPELPRSTYTPGMKIRDPAAEFVEWRVELALATRGGREAKQSTVVTVYETI